MDFDVVKVRWGRVLSETGSHRPVLLAYPFGVGYSFSDVFLRKILDDKVPLEWIPLSRAWFLASLLEPAKFSDPSQTKIPVLVGSESWSGKTVTARYAPLRVLYILAAIIRWELHSGDKPEYSTLLDYVGADVAFGLLRGGVGFLRSGVRFRLKDEEPDREAFLGSMDEAVRAVAPTTHTPVFLSSVSWWHNLVASAVSFSYPELDGPGLRTVHVPGGSSESAAVHVPGFLSFPEAPTPPPVGMGASSPTSLSSALVKASEAAAKLGDALKVVQSEPEESETPQKAGDPTKAEILAQDGAVAALGKLGKFSEMYGLSGSLSFKGHPDSPAFKPFKKGEWDPGPATAPGIHTALLPTESPKMWVGAAGSVLAYVSPDGPDGFKVDVSGAKEWSAQGVADVVASTLDKYSQVPPFPVVQKSGYSSLTGYIHSSPYCAVKVQEDPEGNFQATITGLLSTAKWGPKSLATALHGYLADQAATDNVIADVVPHPPLQKVLKKSLPLVNPPIEDLVDEIKADSPTPLEREVARVHAGFPAGPSKDQIAAILKALPSVLGESLARVGFVSGVSDAKAVADVLNAFLPTEDVITLPDTSWME